MPVLFNLLSLILFSVQSLHDSSTIAFLHQCRHTDGGYGHTKTSTLAGTSAAVRALKLQGSTPEESATTKKYLWSCYQSAVGQFVEQPGGTVSYRATATGIMAVVALGEKFTSTDLAQLQQTLLKSEEPEEVRIGAAAMEALVSDGQLQNVPGEWLALLNRVFKKDRQADGTFGTGAGKARTTAGYAAAYLRLGYPLAEKATVLTLLKSTQHNSGGWTNQQGQPDLESSYRVMRCLFLLRCQDTQLLNRCEQFIQKCKQPDGSYSLAGTASPLSATYFCSSMLYWIAELRK